MKSKIFITLLLTLVFLTGCSSGSGGYTAVESAAIGAGVGAGTGAIVGSVISNGDVLASAGVGAGIGAGTVLVSRYAYQKYQENKEIKDNNLKIKDNYEFLKKNQKDLECYRRHVNYDSNAIEPTDETNRYFEGVN